ncbi:MAG: alpha/beta hydrolase [Holophaga sp.]|nr:alpha/beta hydrolase [Holophaga sp.]
MIPSTNLLKFFPIFLILLCASAVRAQPTIQEVWARHDKFVMTAASKPIPVDPSCATKFKGKRGQTVRGWDVGSRNAPVILTWGGGPGETYSPEYLAASYANPLGYRHVSIDQPGTGESAWLSGWKPEDTVDDAAEFLRLREIKAPVIVTGWSWGSTMALLFAQRHPNLVGGIVVGGVWTNAPEEVAYYLDAAGPRAWMPGISEAFRAFSNGRGTACDLHQAIRDGRGGTALPKAYQEAEFDQCFQGQIPRKPLIEPVGRTESKPVDMKTETDEGVRFAFIESEMMCRGQRGEWRLRLRFPERLSEVPLIVIQGRYDQVCNPEVARRVFRAWPAKRKVFVPFNGGHWNFYGPGKEERTQVGLNLNAEQEAQLGKANRLHFGDAALLGGAAVDCLINP